MIHMMNPGHGCSEDKVRFGSSSLNNFYGSVSVPTSPNRDDAPDIAERVRTRLKWHYMNAYEKYKSGGRKPWKLLVQIIKIFLVTAQVYWFAKRRFSVVNYLDETHQVFEHLFFLNPNASSDRALYTKQDLYEQINFTAFQYERISNYSLGAYGHTCGSNFSDCPVKMCIKKYNNSTIVPSNLFYNFPSTEPTKSCWNITTVVNGSITDFVKQNNIPDDFLGVLVIDLHMSLQTIKIEQLKFGNSPLCLIFNLKLSFKNELHTGKLEAELETVQTYKPCNVQEAMGDELHYPEIFFDIIVICVCTLSFFLTSRSVIRNVKLARFTFRFFKVYKNEKLSFLSDGAELVNVWFIIILLTDILTVVGSVIKIYIDTTNLKETYFYDVCSLCLGIAVLFIWIGILRYLGFLHKYNVLLITLEASLPSVLRFLCCAGILYFGFMFCGWIVLGPYHPKFTTLSEVSECLFSLINGDDMFMTFREMQKDNKELWVFSKFYLYFFISLFIYVVLSLFIGIISDAYERLKSGEHILCSSVKRFIHGPECHCYTRSAMVTSNGTQQSRPLTTQRPDS